MKPNACLMSSIKTGDGVVTGAAVVLQDVIKEEYSLRSSSSKVAASSSCMRIAPRLHELQSSSVELAPFPVSEKQKVLDSLKEHRSG